ncbi:hypothetical protein [Nostoc sp.]|uniref:hypothetical protein n=1 Tax=Nostoc sp. TaxID=1180 RepID=UPI002FF91D12
MSEILNYIEENPQETQRLIGLSQADQREDLIDTPIMKPRNGELTIEQKDEKQRFYANRIFIEHRIRSVKIF